MVKPESFEFNGEKLPRGVNATRATFGPVRLERMATGAWYVSAAVQFEAKLEDGRIVKVDQPIRLRGAQHGKLPNPNPFGRNHKDSTKRSKGKRS